MDTTTETKTVGEASQKDIKGKLVEFAWNMKKENYSKETMKLYGKALKLFISLNADLEDPDTVKEVLARLKVSASRKQVLSCAYTLFLKMQGLTWRPPKLHVTQKIPFIPTEREIDALISGCGKKTATFLQMLKETAMRAGEASKIKWEDVDPERKTVTLNEPEKHGKPRIFNISDRLQKMLSTLKRRNEYVWGTSSKVTRGSVFYRERRKVARRLSNRRLLRIGLHTFRHWKATMLYHETKNPILVKEFLGHRTLDTTLLYIQTEKALFKTENDNFIVKAVAHTNEVKEVLEVGFEYICEKDGLMFFRKRK